MKYLLMGFCSFISSMALAQTEEDAIKSTINQLFEGMRKADSVMVGATFAAQATLRTIITDKDGKTVVKDEALGKFISTVGKPHPLLYDEQVVFESIKIDGPLSTVWAPYKFYADKKFSHCGVDAFQMIKLQGKWLILYLIDTRRKTPCD